MATARLLPHFHAGLLFDQVQGEFCGPGQVFATINDTPWVSLVPRIFRSCTAIVKYDMRQASGTVFYAKVANIGAGDAAVEAAAKAWKYEMWRLVFGRCRVHCLDNIHQVPKTTNCSKIILGFSII